MFGWFKKKKKEENKEPNGIISFGQGFVLTQGMPVVSLYQGDTPFNFLLDTGSNDSIIDSNVLDKIEHTMSKEKGCLYGLGAESIEVGWCNITLSYGGVNYPYDYIVNDMSGPFNKIKTECGVVLHGVIGSKFFNVYKYVLDFDKLIAYSKK